MRFVYHSPNTDAHYTLSVRGSTAISRECRSFMFNSGPCKHVAALTRLVAYVRRVQEAWRDNMDLLAEAWD